MEEALLRVGIPYKVVGGTRFYDRREIKDALAYLRAAVNPVDEVSVKRVLNVPKRGVGDSSVGRLDAWATANGEPFVEALRSAPEAGVTGRAIGGIDEFLDLLDRLAELAPDGPAPVLEAALERSGYLAELQAERTRRGRGPAREPRRARSASPASSTTSTSSSSRCRSSPTPTSCPTPRAARSCS